MNKDKDVLGVFKGPLRTRVRLTAADKTVPKGERAWLRVKAAPCRGRRHDRVKLFRGRKRIGAKRLDRHCVAHFHPRIKGRSRFRAKVGADRRHLAGRSAAVLVIPSR
jgi:metallophosphoesterase superfamily enzyme